MSRNNKNPSIGTVILLVGWIAGIVLSQGWKAMTIAILLPPYAWYLIIEELMRYFGIIGYL